MQENIVVMAQSCIAALAYSWVFYAKNHKKKGQTFEFKKMAPTLLVGLGVGFAFAQTGVVPDQTSFEARMAGMTGTIALVETLIKAAVNSLPDPEEL